MILNYTDLSIQKSVKFRKLNHMNILKYVIFPKNNNQNETNNNKYNL